MSPPFEVTIRRTAWHVAALRLQTALARLRLTLRGYDPDQPRIPAGQSGGGRWTDGDEGDSGPLSDDARIVFVSDGDTRKYSVDLQEEEARGGHTLREHVGKTDEEMLRRVRSERFDFSFVTVGRYRDGSFASRESANDFVNRTLEQNESQVDRIVNGDAERAFVTARFGYRTGREAYRPDDDREPYIRETYGVGVEVRRDQTSPRGYRVHTAYPRND